ncbi:hypothetical protein EJ04DRAFT_508743 [Polyplosphaeria fusca]|uniref:Double-strand-break repair protein rad21 n=1 Tax=Polyplosphaeria fusca TaxID=682080 RepID=A0A9P4R5E9_9PLEO|nr:hypothetical protein EJ04DRAFT_508743 [Polyplosphaeria fusca]
MFYPDHLLNKAGALSRVWLACNWERKLNKSMVMQDKITDDVNTIMRPDVSGGPLALRLSGQLLLGVTRIYKRKVGYLYDDCNDSLMRIRLFRPANVDLPSTQSHVANAASLLLPDTITELDLFLPMADVQALLGQPQLDLEKPGAFDDVIAPDWDSSQFLSGSIEQPRAEPTFLDDEDALELDPGYDYAPMAELDEGISVEVGRNAPHERRMSEELASSPKLLDEEDLGLDDGADYNTTVFPLADPVVDSDGDINMDGATGLGAEETVGATPAKARSVSPLSSIHSSVERGLEQTFQEGTTTGFQPEEAEEEEEEEIVQQANRVKRRKILHADADTEIHSTQIREQQTDRSKILKPASFLPRDPMLLALMNMQKSGAFVSSILGDGRGQGWAPELRGIMSLEVVARPPRRKRDSGVADLETEEEGHEKTPQLEFDQSEPDLGGGAEIIGEDSGIAQDDEMIQLPDEPGVEPFEQDDDFGPAADTFEDTTVPLLNPTESGPISLATKKVVFLLRDRFGSDESQRQKRSVLFQDLVPERTTTRKDATRLFTDMLVLATKDCIKVEQPAGQLGGPIRIRGRENLWKDWAAAGETSESEEAAPATVAVET